MADNRRKIKKPQKQSWVRSGGAMGESTMDEMDAFIRNGCGVSEEIEDVGDMPNEKFLRKPNKKHIV